MFDRDIRHHRPTARTLNEAFGPYARLHVEPEKHRSWPYVLVALLATACLAGCVWIAS